MSDVETVKSAVRALNDAWLAGRFDDMRRYVHPDVVLVRPDFGDRVVGRDVLIGSYQDFARDAKVLDFNCGEAAADSIGDTVVTSMSWQMKYEYAGSTYDESGWDLLVWNRVGEEWVVVWRTVVLKK